MKQKFEVLRETLSEFVQQDEFPALVVSVRSEELAYVSKFLQDLEQPLPSHLIACFPQTYEEPGRWLDAIVASMRTQIDYAEPARVERGDPPYPPLPLELTDTRCPPIQRLHALVRYLPSLLPNPQEYRAVLGLLPSSCSDPAGFAELMAQLVPADIPDWMPALRLVVWDEPEQGLLRTELAARASAHALFYRDDLSTPALTDALAQDAANPRLPLDERMGALTQLAALDYSYGRHDAALAKYAVLHEHYRKTGQPELQAMSLLGAGDTLHAAKDPVMAKTRLQQGLVLAMEHKSLPALVCLLGSVVKVSMSLGQHADAESYADSGTKAAAAAINPFAYCDFLAQRGDAQLAQGKLVEAIESYNKAREQCRANEYHQTWLEVIDRQVEIYGHADYHAERRMLEDERALVEELARHGPRRSS